MSCWRRTTASLVLGGAVSPWLPAGLLALHLGRHAAGHEGEGPHDGLAIAFHGHHHEAGIPDHQHLLTLPAAAPVPRRAWLAPAAAVTPHVAAEAALAPTRATPGPRCVGHDPPFAQRSFSVLRI